MINTIAPRYWTRAGDARLIGNMTVLERGTGPAGWTHPLGRGGRGARRQFEGATMLELAGTQFDVTATAQLVRGRG
ncbi:MAG: hypothetical protein WB713_16640 [Methyloceanibacter sp.]